MLLARYPRSRPSQAYPGARRVGSQSPLVWLLMMYWMIALSELLAPTHFPCAALKCPDVLKLRRLVLLAV